MGSAVYTQKDIDYVHDTLTDLLLSTVQYLPFEEPQVGDWCVNIDSVNPVDNDDRIGILEHKTKDDSYIILTIGGKKVTWHNAIFKKLPSQCMRNPVTLSYLRSVPYVSHE